MSKIANTQLAIKCFHDKFLLDTLLPFGQFPDIFAIAVKFSDISRFFRQLVEVSDNDADLRVGLRCVIAVVRRRFHVGLRTGASRRAVRPGQAEPHLAATAMGRGPPVVVVVVAVDVRGDRRRRGGVGPAQRTDLSLIHI